MHREGNPRNGAGGEAGPDVAEHVQALMDEYLRLTAETGLGDQGLGIGCSVFGVRVSDPAPGTEHRIPNTHHPTPNAASLKQQVVAAMAPVVEAIARRYTGSREAGGEPLEDLISEGYVGLLAAIDQYRPDRGARFSTYATHRIQGQIRHYLRDRGSRRLIRAPSWLQELSARLQKEEAKLQAELGRPATTAELAERLNLQEEAVEEILMKGASPTILSLSEGGEDEEDGCVDLSKIRSQHYVSWQLPVEDNIFLEGLMVRLKELERNVIQLFFFQEFSQSEIARTLNISCNYVGYLLNNGLRRLRKLIEADELRDAHLRFSYAPRCVAGDPSVIDPVTGLYTAAYFRGRLAEELARAYRYGRRLALVVVRVPLPARDEEARGRRGDGETGRQGDEETGTRGRRGGRRASARRPLAPSSPRPVSPSPPPAPDREPLMGELGVALRECLRKADIPAWLGEGTFAVVMPHTAEGAATAATRIASLLARVAGCQAHSGVAIYPADARDPGALLEVATGRAEEAGDSQAPAQHCGMRRPPHPPP